jgi:diguanylate cyclase (GGDEF)-like protein/PAS domain S-box-containing protein
VLSDRTPADGLQRELGLLRGLFEAAVRAVVVVDQAGEIVLVNAAAEALFGYGREELVGEQVEILVPKRLREGHRRRRERFTAEGLTRRMGIGLELIACRKDGIEFPVEIGLSRLQADEGVLISAAICDISERRHAQAQIASLAAIVESCDDAMIAKTLQGTITTWNPAAERMYGYTTAEAVGRQIRILCPTSEHEDEVARILARVASGERIDHFETTRRRKDGSVIDVSVTISPIHDSRGEVAGASTVARDITERKRAADALAEAEQRFRGAFEESPIGIVMLDRRLGVLRVNDALCRLLGRDAAQIVGRSILEFTHPDDVAPSRAWNESRSRGNVLAPLVKRYVRPDGSIVEVQVTTTALVEPHDSEPYFFSQLQDVTERRCAERQNAVIADLGRRALGCADVVALMDEAVRSVREILATTLCIIARCSADGAVRLVAADGESLGWTIGPGYPTQTAYTLQVGKPVVSDDLLSETRFSTPPTVLERGMRRSVSVPVPDRSGSRHVILAHLPAGLRRFTDDDVRFVEAVAHVVAGALDRAAAEDELRRRALEDPLTGLANRALLSSQLETELRHARRLHNRVCVLALDLDRFKIINDTLGHSAGDVLLLKVAARLAGCMREEDLIARPGGNEFTVIATRTATDHAIAEVAQRLIDAVIDPFELDGREVFITASVGVAVSDHGSETPEELLRDADAAMYRAKEQGGGRYEIFDVTLRHHLVQRMAIEADLRHAIERSELELYYQPLIDLTDERVVGFEALLRWRHPERGMIAPDQFIQIAEETRLIIPIGSWVLQTVCAQLAQWPQQIHVAANLSALQITPELTLEVQRQLAQHRVAPDRLVLEITESLVLDPSTKPIVTSLRALGIKLALDDFGTGYSSLGSLQRFPLDLLKLDRTLISSLDEPKGVAVIRAAIELGNALGVDVIAEGIETPTQLATLRNLKCPLGQGYLFARPLPLTEAQQLIDRPAQPATAGPRRGDLVTHRLAAAFGEALRAGDPHSAASVVDDALGSGLSSVEIQSRVIAPAMWAIGELWELAQLTIADEHLATAVSHHVLTRLHPGLLAHAQRRSDTVLVAAVHGEQHVLGLRMVADVFEGAGYNVRFLGAGVPESLLAAWVSEHHPAIVALGATMPLNAATLARQLQALRDCNPELMLIIGGQGVPAVLRESPGVLYAADTEQLAKLANTGLTTAPTQSQTSILSGRFPPARAA